MIEDAYVALHKQEHVYLFFCVLFKLLQTINNRKINKVNK